MERFNNTIDSKLALVPTFTPIFQATKSIQLKKNTLLCAIRIKNRSSTDAISDVLCEMDYLVSRSPNLKLQREYKITLYSKNTEISSPSHSQERSLE